MQIREKMCLKRNIRNKSNAGNATRLKRPFKVKIYFLEYSDFSFIHKISHVIEF